MGVRAEQRRREILKFINENGRLEVPELAETLHVAPMTVRRDLAILESDGLLKRVYGGAVLTAPDFQASVRYRQTRNLEAKKVVGKLAADLINDGDTIYFEAGSTCYEIIPYLAMKHDLTIIVNSLYLMRRLGQLTGHKILIIGGQYRPDRMDMVGPSAERAIAELGGFKAFTGADDITIDAGISGADVVTVGFARLVVKQATEVIFVGDHTKFDNPALYKIADIDELSAIVTDREPKQAWKKAANEKKIRLVFPVY